MTGPILALPENDGTYILDTDVSDVIVGAVLSQLQSGVKKVTAYASRTMSVAERKYDTTRKELLAVVYGLKQFSAIFTWPSYYHPYRPRCPFLAPPHARTNAATR